MSEDKKAPAINDCGLQREVKRKLGKVQTRVVEEYIAMIFHNPNDALGLTFMTRGSQNDPDLSSAYKRIQKAVETAISDDKEYIERYVSQNYRRVMNRVLDEIMYEHAKKSVDSISLEKLLKG